jgi:hypothetical protein
MVLRSVREIRTFLDFFFKTSSHMWLEWPGRYADDYLDFTPYSTIEPRLCLCRLRRSDNLVYTNMAHI